MHSLEILASQRFFVIAGTSKAGTTAVFNYLEKHPEVVPSRTKETRFFLDADYPLPSDFRCETDGVGSYLSFFPDLSPAKTDSLALEATPDYLYSRNTAQRIRQHLARARLVFLLREPFSRLVSYYRFGQQMNEIPLTMSFDEYVGLQKQSSGSELAIRYSHPAFCALH